MEERRLNTPIWDECFHIVKVQVRNLEEVPAVTPFQDSTMGPFRSFNMSILTLEDADGNIGEGPVYGGYSNILQGCILPVLLRGGQVRYGDLYPLMYWAIRNEGFRGPAGGLLGQVDLALYDLVCRRKGVSLHRYLGAKRDYAAAYGSGMGTNYSFAELDAEIGYFLDQGLTCMKMKVGTNFGTRMKEDAERVRFVRRHAGRNVRLAIDANQVWTAQGAMEFFRLVEDQDIAWFEEPVHSADITEIEKLANISPLGLSFGESERSGKVFPALVSAGVKHLQPVPTHLASVREWMDVRDLAAQSGLTFSSGGYSLYTAALMATATGDAMVEHLYPLMDGLQSYFSERPVLTKGHFELPDIPGIPIRIAWDELERQGRIMERKTWTSAEFNRRGPRVLI